MPHLNPKHTPPRRGATKISSEFLAQLQRTQERQLVGSDSAQVSYYGDRVLISGQDITNLLSDVTNYLVQFKVVEEFDDFLKCQVYEQPVDVDGLLTTDLYEKDVVVAPFSLVWVAKPFHLQKTPWDGRDFTTPEGGTAHHVYDTVLHGVRTVEPGGVVQKIIQPYMPGDIILACMVLTGLVNDYDDGDIVWMDVNAAGRHWGVDPAPVGGAVHVTSNYNITAAQHFFLFDVDASTHDVGLKLPDAPPVPFGVWVRRIDTVAGGSIFPVINNAQIYFSGAYNKVNIWSAVFPFQPCGFIPSTTSNTVDLVSQNQAVFIAFDGEKWTVTDSNSPPILVSLFGAPEGTTTTQGHSVSSLNVNYATGVSVQFSLTNEGATVTLIGIEANAIASGGMPFGQTRYLDAHMGMVTKNAQTWVGRKTFSDGVTSNNGLKLTITRHNTTDNPGPYVDISDGYCELSGTASGFSWLTAGGAGIAFGESGFDVSGGGYTFAGHVSNAGMVGLPVYDIWGTRWYGGVPFEIVTTKGDIHGYDLYNQFHSLIDWLVSVGAITFTEDPPP